MANGGGLKWETDSIYSEAQVSYVLQAIGVRVEGETESVYIAYCPFHGNHDTPSFAVNKQSGLYICYNPACNRTGNLMKLLKSAGGLDDFGARRLLARAKLDEGSFLSQLQRVTEVREDFPEYVHPTRPNYMRDIQTDFWKYAEPQMYMRGRGFEKETLKKFQVGYDIDEDMVCVPMWDPMGRAKVVAVRRSIEGKRFKNTPGLPTSKTLFNIHNAKKTGDSVVIVEASFSAMRLDQCGYSNAVAVLMGHFNETHANLIDKYFNKVVIMTDFDSKSDHVYRSCPKCTSEGSGLCKGHNPGEELGKKIAKLLPHKDLMWAHCGGPDRFPAGTKDPDDMDDETIRYSIKNAVSHFEYLLD